MLPFEPPIAPMLAKLVRDIPSGDLVFEPKWDGFRCIVFRDGDNVFLQSRGGKDLGRYFPELVDPQGPDPLRQHFPSTAVIDGELVVPRDGALDFDALSNRIHPAATRIELLAAETPAHFIAFDVLACDDADLRDTAFATRRDALESLFASVPPPLHLTPATRDGQLATAWFDRFEGAGLDGVIAKPSEGVYAPGKRTLFKVKRQRTADVVVAGFRTHKDGKGVGSLLLGLWDGDDLIPVGVASSFSATRRRELVSELAPYQGTSDGHPWEVTQAPRGANRWNAGRDTSWEPLNCQLVAEVAYEQLAGNRFRHSARFQRWRLDRDPASCTFDQLDVPPPAELTALFGQQG